MPIVTKGLIGVGGGSGGGETIWLSQVVRVGGTFLATTISDSVAGSVSDIIAFATDAPTVTLTIIIDRGSSFEPTLLVNGVQAVRDAGNTVDTLTSGTFMFTVTVPTAATLVLISSGGGSLKVPVQQDSPAIVSDLTIVNNPASGTFYPVGQTELKAGDPVYVSFVTDKDITNVRGNGPTGGNTVVAGTIHDGIQLFVSATGIIATLLNMEVNTTSSAGAVSTITAISDNQVLCNNLHPTVTIDSYGYPANQRAIKNAESCTVNVTTTDFDTIDWTAPLAQISIPNPLVDSPSKDVTRQGSLYNVSNTNLQITANRVANGSTTVTDGVVNIVNVGATIGVTAGPTALRSGGNDGTNAQTYTVTVSSTQQLWVAPLLNMSLGNPQNGGFTWSSTATTFTRSLVITDNTARGVGIFDTLTAIGLSGIQVNTFGFNPSVNYTVAGFVQRNMTLPAFNYELTINVPIVNINNVAVHWQFTNQNLILNGTETRPTVNGFFIRNPTSATPTIVLLDKSGTDSSTQDSIVEIQEGI